LPAGSVGGPSVRGGQSRRFLNELEESVDPEGFGEKRQGLKLGQEPRPERPGRHSDRVRGDPAPPQLAQDVPTVPVGQIEVEDENVRTGVGEGTDRGLARLGFADEQAALYQVRSKNPSQDGVILDEEYLSIHVPSLLSTTSQDYAQNAQRRVNMWASGINV
jgi:hypothetical protein